MLVRTGQVFILAGLVVAFYALGASQSQKEVIRYRYLPRQLDDVADIDSAGLEALQKTLS